MTEDSNESEVRDEAHLLVKKVLGIPEEIDLLAFDPINAIKTQDQETLDAGVILHKFNTSVISILESTGSVFSANLANARSLLVEKMISLNEQDETLVLDDDLVSEIINGVFTSGDNSDLIFDVSLMVNKIQNASTFQDIETAQKGIVVEIESDVTTNNMTPVISGIATTGAMISVSIGGAIYETVATSGKWSVNTATAIPKEGTIDLLLNDNNEITVTATDPSGEISSVTSQPLLIDTTPPSEPTIGIDLAPVSDSGNFNFDNKTSDTSPIIRVALKDTDANVGDTVEILLNGSPFETALETELTLSNVIMGYVDFEIPDGSLGSDGTKDITARVIDLAGNIGSAGGLLTISLDTDTPGAPTEAIDLLQNFDSGKSSLDNITNSTSPTVRLNLDGNNLSPGDIVELLLDDNALNNPVKKYLSQTDITNGFIDLTIAEGDLGSDGVKQLSVMFTDAAGNIGTAGGNLNITLKTTAPLLTISSPIMVDGVVNVLEHKNVSVGGTTTHVEDGQIVTVTFNDTSGNSVEAEATVSGNTWSLKGNEADLSGLNNGQISIVAVVTDIAGNTSDSVTQTIVLDNTPPSDFAIDETLAIDNIINSTEDDSLIISGSVLGVEKDQEVLIRLTDGINKVDVTATVDANGTWSTLATDVSVLQNGSITVFALTKDSAGNFSTTASKKLILDNIHPADLTIDSKIAIDNVVNSSEDSNLTISGTSSGVEAGQLVSVNLFDGSNSHDITAMVGDDGSWISEEADISMFRNGNIMITVNVSDAAGNEAIPATKTIRLDNKTATNLITDEILEIDNIVIAENNDSVTVSGTSSGIGTGQIVNVSLNDGTTQITTTATVAADGIWSTTDTDISMLNRGDINITADIKDSSADKAIQTSRTMSLDNISPSVTNIDIQNSSSGKDLLEIYFNEDMDTDSFDEFIATDGNSLLINGVDKTSEVSISASSSSKKLVLEVDANQFDFGDSIELIYNSASGYKDVSGNLLQDTSFGYTPNVGFEGIVIENEATEIDSYYLGSTFSSGTIGSGDSTAQVVLDISAVDETDGVELWIDGVKVFEDTVSADDIANGQLNTGEIDFSQHDSENDQSVNLEVKVTHNGEYVQDNGDTTWEYQW